MNNLYRTHNKTFPISRYGLRYFRYDTIPGDHNLTSLKESIKPLVKSVVD